MTLPSVTSDLLMFPPSFNRTPVAPVASARSLPAKSTRWILLNVSLGISASNFAWKTSQKCSRLITHLLYPFFQTLIVTPTPSDLCEVDGKDGVRPTADVVHTSAGGGAIEVSSLHQLLHITVVLHQVFGQIWEGRKSTRLNDDWPTKITTQLSSTIRKKNQ